MTQPAEARSRAPVLHHAFPRYSQFAPAIPVYRITSTVSGAIHRFYDTSPFSPSGRYLALTCLPSEDRLPIPGDVADVMLVDLETGAQEVLAQTRAWDTQLGAQVQWGADDHSLYFNDLDPQSWRPFGVRLDPLSNGTPRLLAGTVYAVSPDGTRAASPCLRRLARTQAGYGVIVPPQYVPRNRGAPEDDGVYVVDTETGESALLVSIAEIVERVFSPAEREQLRDGDFYAFHVKWNPQGTRLLLVLRWVREASRWGLRREQRLSNVIVMNTDASQLARPITDRQWRLGGDHPNWCPDGERVIMNLNVRGDGPRLIEVRWDGTGLRLLSESLIGSGHPTLHADGVHVLTDTYCYEAIAFGDGTTPLRWLNVERSTERTLVRIRTRADFVGPRSELRVDPHPAWDRGFERIAFNACPTGKREVLVADMAGIVNAATP